MMATCLCRQPCERHKFPVMTMEDWIDSANRLSKEFYEKHCKKDLGEYLEAYRVSK